jgi:hypothetical protein
LFLVLARVVQLVHQAMLLLERNQLLGQVKKLLLEKV